MWWKCFPPEFLLIHMNLKIKVCMLAHSQAQNVLSGRTPYSTGVIDTFFGSFLGPTCGAAQHLAGLQTPFSGRKSWNINKWLAKFIRSELLWIQWSFPRMLQPHRDNFSLSLVPIAFDTWQYRYNNSMHYCFSVPSLSFPQRQERLHGIGLRQK